VDGIKIIRLGWVGHIVRMEDERIPRKFIMGNYIIQNQWENQGQDRRASSGVIHRRRQRRMEESSKDGQGPEGTVAP
jgi:hypothetical protein